MRRHVIKAEPRKCWRSRGIEDADAHLVAAGIRYVDEALAAYRGNLGKFGPGAPVPLVDCDTPHPLTQRKVFAQFDHVESDRAAQIG